MVFVYDQAGRVLEASLRDGSSSFFGDLVWVEGELLGRVEDDVAVGTAAWVPPAARPWLPGPDRLWLVAVGAGGTLLLLSVALRTRSPRWGTAGATLALALVVGVACVPNGVAFYWVVTDHLGTPIAMTNTPTSGEAKVIWKASYQPFGKAIEDLDPDGDGKSIRMPVRFPGQWWDFNTGLHYNFFRDYDPKSGRYLEADPIGQAGAVSLYAYALKSPNNMIDPRGEFSIYIGSFGSAGAGASAQSQAAWAIDSCGNVGLVLTQAFGGQLGVSGSVGLVAGASVAPTIHDLSGPSLVGGGTFGSIGTFGVDAVAFDDRAGNRRGALEVQIGAGGAIEAHVQGAATGVIPLFNVVDAVAGLFGLDQGFGDSCSNPCTEGN